ncbi:MAG: hypothetical protein RML56_08785 [Burkholderiales bacterium]|nr:hypothetical protein [Burkholderiales bacterium]
MLGKRKLISLAALSLACGVGANALAQSAEKAAEGKKGRNVVAKAAREATPQARALDLARLADRLASYGEQRKDALSLIVAARLFAEAGVQPATFERSAGKGKGEQGAPAPQPREATVSGLLARARQYAGERKDLLALADDVEKAGVRGAVGGPRAATYVVNAFASDIFRVTFRGLEPALVGISGDGDTDLDLFVYDDAGRLVCRSERPVDEEICQWVPRWTGVFRIEVRNLGRVWNRYLILTN